LSGGFLGFFDAMGIPFQIFELQRISGDKIGIVFDKGTRVHHTVNPSPGWNLKMVVALGANLKVSFDHLSVDDLIAGVTFHPELVGEFQFLPLLYSLFFFLFPFFEPGHLFCSSSLIK
jgi:hypothetical protein